MPHGFLPSVGLLMVIAMVSGSVEAATFTVTNLNDSGPGSLRQAIFEANALAGADTIRFQAGLVGTINLTSGPLRITDDLIIEGLGSNLLTVNNANSWDGRVFIVDDLDYSKEIHVLIDGISITGGITRDFSRGGGGIFNAENLTILNSVISGNESKIYRGGGIHNIGTLTLNNTSVVDNKAAFGGGGIYNHSGVLTITNSSFLDNSSAAEYGGGISIFQGFLDLSNSTVSGNRVIANGCGGGVANLQGTVILAMVGIENNYVLDTGAGVTIIPCGGGLYNNGTMNILDSTVSNNYVRPIRTGSFVLGGGIHNTGVLALANTTVSSNVAYNGLNIMGEEIAYGYYGGIANADTLTIDYSTIANNQALTAVGGIVNSGGTVNLSNSIVGDNSSPYAYDDIVSDGPVNITGFNIIEDGSRTGSNIINADPKLEPLSDNGGPTLTHALQSASPAIDQIPSGTHGCGTDIATDQRGVARPQGAGCDIGAYEAAPADPDHLTLQNVTVTGPAIYTARLTITAGPAFTVESSGHATFTAGQRITLRPGFRVQAGGRFNARIDTALATTSVAPTSMTAESHPLTEPQYASPLARAAAELEYFTPAATALTWSELPQGLRERLNAHDARIREAQYSEAGQVISFATEAALVGHDDNDYSDIYLYEMDSDRLTLISTNLHGQAANAPSTDPRLAADGQTVIYTSTATDLVSGTQNAYRQLYQYDRLGTTTRLTVTATVHPGNGDTSPALIAGDWIIYTTQATNLGSEGRGLYRQHLYSGQRELIGLDHWGQPDPQASQPTATADGEQIAYQRPEQQRWQILLYDLLSVERLSLLYDPVYGLLDHCCAVLSADGHFIAYREQGEHGPAWLHLLDRDTDRHTRLPWPEDEALQERAPQFRNDATELWWINPEQGPGQPEILQRVDNPLR